MEQPEFNRLADEALDTFNQISDKATQKLNESIPDSSQSFAAGNTLTGGKAIQNLVEISRDNAEALKALTVEPAIARLTLEDESGNQKAFYISRKSSLTLADGKQLASYESPIGRLAALPVGEEGTLKLNGDLKNVFVVEKTIFHTKKSDGIWDSLNNEYRHEKLGTFSIESLRALLIDEGMDAGDDLDRLLEQAEAANGVVQGIAHQIRTAMGLRDQPILDKFQDDIFRLPIDSQLIILGPPGTGKTTTLIKRLGQKLDRANLEEAELSITKTSFHELPFESSWLMFTPSDLLKHYLKEAFNREQVPASDERVKAWATYRNDLARNSLGILKTPNGGKFTFKPSLKNMSSEVIDDPRSWYEAFREFHIQRIKSQLREGAEIANSSAAGVDSSLVERLILWAKSLERRPLVDAYRELNELESDIRPALDKAKESADKLLKNERNRIHNNDNEVFPKLAGFLATLQNDDEDLDVDAEFDEDEQDEVSNPSRSDIQVAVKAYLSSMRALARYKYRNRTIPKNIKAAQIRDWLGDRIPTDETLRSIGQSISFQNGLRRFVNAFKRYISDVPTSYRLFRKINLNNPGYYQSSPTNPFQLSDTEIDAILLLMLRNARELLVQPFVTRDFEALRFESIRNIGSLFRHQIMVDEATDFSSLQLACMESLTNLKSKSFFACGDFNQRITATGVQSLAQLDWILPNIKPERINIVYRQSRELNSLAAGLLTLMGGDETTIGKVPDESTHDGVRPVLFEGASDADDLVRWLAERIAEVERSVKQMPTIAVLVNDEEEVKPIADALTLYLEDINLKAVACDEGKALGEGSDVRVFDIKHIKGLEFEAVFFVGVDKLADRLPDLFDRYLYVGITRAATYLGILCYDSLPVKLEPIRPMLNGNW